MKGVSLKMTLYFHLSLCKEHKMKEICVVGGKGVYGVSRVIFIHR